MLNVARGFTQLSSALKFSSALRFVSLRYIPTRSLFKGPLPEARSLIRTMADGAAMDLETVLTPFRKRVQEQVRGEWRWLSMPLVLMLFTCL